MVLGMARNAPEPAGEVRRLGPDSVKLPSLPLVEGWPGASASAPAREQRRRRSCILALTRKMISEQGYDGVVMKDIAEACEVSTQTIYNLIGGRFELAAAAVNEYVASSFELTRLASAYPNRLMALVDVYALTIKVDPGFVRQATLGYFLWDERFRSRIRLASRREFGDAVMTTSKQGALRRDVDPYALADRLSCFCVATIFDWAIGYRSDDDLCSDLAEGLDLLLRGALDWH